MIFPFVSPVKQANTFVYPLVHLARQVLFLLNYFIVICGHQHMLVFLVLNIILLFLMILHTMSGPFLCIINPMVPQYSLTFKNMFLSTSFCLFDLSNVTMAMNLTIFKIIISFSNTEFFYVFLVLTPLLKTARRNALFVLSMILSAPS